VGWPTPDGCGSDAEMMEEIIIEKLVSAVIIVSIYQISG